MNLKVLLSIALAATLSTSIANGQELYALQYASINDPAPAVQYEEPPSTYRPPTTTRGALLDEYTGDADSAIRHLYSKRDYEPLWYQHPSAVDAWVEQLKHSQIPGLSKYSSAISSIDSIDLITPNSDENLVKNELQLTEAFFAFANHLSQYMPTNGGEPAVNIGDLLERSVKSDSIEHAFTLLMPPHDQYHLLLDKLNKYEEIANQGGWGKIGFGKLIKPLQYDIRIPLVRQRLGVTGDLPIAEVNDNEQYDAMLASAVRKFQRRQGIKPNAVIGKTVIQKMNASVEYRIRQIKANLRRWHDMPIDLGEKNITVNIPDYSLAVNDGPRVLMKLPIIVGRRDRPTPILSDELEKLVVNPHWNVPRRIAINDILPMAINDPNKLVDKKIRVLQGWGHELQELNPLEVNWTDIPKHKFPFRFRQDPGPLNAMGEIKFLFPNAHNVYVHGTPSKNLFAKKNRSLSSGCIRVENPVGLAAVLLQDELNISYDEINEIVDSGEKQEVRFQDPWNVHLVYWTAWVDEQSGEMNFRRDIYRKDREQ